MHQPLTNNTLFYGDNLDILREYVPTEGVDLIYLDPPFNSNRSYNLLFKDESGQHSEAQIEAFEDTWHWSETTEETYRDLVTNSAEEVSRAMSALRELIGTNQVMAYLVMMSARLVELHRTLRETGTLYLHCDTTASHYLKIVLDAIFGPTSFMNEVSWKRSSAHSDTKQGMKRYGKIRDVLLVYTKAPLQSRQHTWNTLYTPYTEEYLESEYRHQMPDGRRYKETDVTAAKPGGDVEFDWRVKRSTAPGSKWTADLDNEYLNPEPDYEYLGVQPYSGRFWAYSKSNLREMAETGHLIHRKTGMPRLVQYADEMPGISLQDSWDGIYPASGAEDLGYPTQKPLKLLERIIETSSNPGDVVLDPFCGCGTAIAASQKLGRRWMGIDVTHLSIALQKSRMQEMFPGINIEVRGEPEDLASAQQLFTDNPYQFQWWAVSLVNAWPLGSNASQGKKGKKGADRGVDGTLTFLEDRGKKRKSVVVQVKGGKNVGVGDIRDLVGTIDRPNSDAVIGVYISLQKPTKPMQKEALEAGWYSSIDWGKDYRKIQLFTIEELLNGAEIQMPPQYDSSKKAQRAQLPEEEHPQLDL